MLNMLFNIDNDEALERVLLSEIKGAMKYSAEMARDEIKRNVEEIVYKPYTPTAYRRLGENGGFLGSWVAENLPMENPREIGYWIFSDPDRMTVDYPHHESWGGDSRAEIMSESIIRGINWDFSYRDRSRNEWWKKRRDFWTPSARTLNKDFLPSAVSFKMRSSLGSNFDFVQSV